MGVKEVDPVVSQDLQEEGGEWGHQPRHQRMSEDRLQRPTAPPCLIGPDSNFCCASFVEVMSDQAVDLGEGLLVKEA